jgi:hypothetical protein
LPWAGAPWVIEIECGRAKKNRRALQPAVLGGSLCFWAYRLASPPPVRCENQK